MQERFLDTEKFTAAAVEACNRARLETLAAGVPVFYRDADTKIDIMEMPDGRKFQVRYVPSLPGQRNYEVVGELHRSAA
jgi:hypothetical protein